MEPKLLQSEIVYQNVTYMQRRKIAMKIKKNRVLEIY